MQSGDVILVSLYLEDSNPAVTPPAGFTELTFSPVTESSGVGVFHLRMFWKRTTAADTGTYAFTHPAAITEATASAFTGVVTTGTPVRILQSATTEAYADNPPAVSGTTLVAGEMLFYALSNYAFATNMSPPAGFTLAYQAASTDGILTAYKIQAAPGATGSVAATNASTGSPWVVALISLTPQPTAQTLSSVLAASAVASMAVGSSIQRVAFLSLAATQDFLTVGGEATDPDLYVLGAPVVLVADDTDPDLYAATAGMMPDGIDPDLYIVSTAQTFTSVLPVVGAGGFLIGGMASRSQVLAATAAPRILIGPLRTAPAALPAAASSALTVAAVVSRSAVLAMSAPSDNLVVAPLGATAGALAMGGVPVLLVSGQGATSGVLSASAVGAVVLGPVRQQFATWAATAVGAATLAAVRQQLAALAVGAAGGLTMLPAVTGLLAARGTPALALAGFDATSAAVAMGGVAALTSSAFSGSVGVVLMAATQDFLTVGAGLTKPAVLAVRGTPALGLTGLRQMSAVWTVRATPVAVVGGSIVVFVLNYRPVISRVLDNGLRTVLLDPSIQPARLLDGTGLARIMRGV